MNREIVGMIDGKCDYTEQMPNSGKMECKYDESTRKAVTQEYKDLAAATSIEAGGSMDLVTGYSTSTYKINGKVVSNPLQDATDNGICVISGYNIPQ